MKALKMFTVIAMISLVGCSATSNSTTFNDNWTKTDIYAYMDANVGEMNYDRFVETLGEPVNVTTKEGCKVCTWVKQNATEQYQLMLTFDSASNFCRQYSYGILKSLN